MATLTQAIEHIPASDYHSRIALSNSGMKDLAVSPLRYWHLNINPNRPVREATPEMQFGTALHCLVLEGEAVFSQRYARAAHESDYPGCLVTVDDLREYLRDRNIKPKGTRKDDLIRQVREVDSSIPIWDLIDAEDERMTAGKRVACKEEYQRLFACADALRNEPKVRELLDDGEPEVSIFAEDAQTGIPLKARLDWLSGDYILDLKTFTQKRGKSIDESIADAIWYERYARQAVLYATLHQQVSGKRLPFILVFIESEPPFHVRIKELRPFRHGVANVYWQIATIEIRQLCSVWADYMREFGVNPWKRKQDVEALLDEEIKQLAWAS